MHNDTNAKMNAKWLKPRICPKCGHVHMKAEEAKSNSTGFYCTWCETPLVISKNSRELEEVIRAHLSGKPLDLI